MSMRVAIPLMAVGLCLWFGGWSGSRGVGRSTEVPKSARMLGEWRALSDWQRSNEQVGTLMRVLGTGLFVLGVVLGLISLF